MRVSSGCIRLRDDDIKTLFSQVTPGTKVNIINTPIKVSAEPNGARLVEVHQPLCFWNLNLSGVDLRQLRILTWQHNIDIAAQQRRIRGELGNQHFPS